MAKRHSKKDPHHKREAEKYDNPVASREHIMQTLKDQGKPTTLEDLSALFHIKTEEEHEGLRRRLRAMERDGQLMRTRRNAYALISQLNLIPGRVLGHRDGFGFLIPDDGSPDLFLSGHQMRQVFTDDRVLVSASKEGHRRKREGRIVEVLERNTQRLVGKFYIDDGIAFVSADNKTISHDIVVLPDGMGDARSGQFVIVDIIQQPSKRHQAIGKVVEILGDQLTPGMEVDLAIRSHNLPFEWPSDVAEETAQFATTLDDTDLKDRLDLRQLPFCTIDGEDARDFDDAIYCETSDTGWVLYVAIADVSHYVKPGMALDQEGLHRGNSVYFPSRVIPMLPEALSNEMCSLKPREDRLTMVCKMHIDHQGLLMHYEFHNAVIHSHERFTYTQVAELLTTATNTHPLQSNINDFYQLYQQLVAQRKLRGSIEFETTETRMVFDDDGKIAKIIPVFRNDAHKMIEESMLLANVCASRFIEAAKMPALYRVHESPDEEKITLLRDFLKAFGLRMTGGDKPQPYDFSKLLKRIESRKDAHLLQTVMLRSLPQAVYLPENLGHFGLAFEGYTHFTSPIRRYPDLLVHRAIKAILLKKKSTITDEEQQEMRRLGEHCSMTERRADRASRSASDWLKCDYMQDKVGQTFEGVIVDVTGFGLFVELKDIYVQGLVHITALKNDYYQHDAVHHVLSGRQSNTRYRLGDALTVMVARVDIDNRKIDFEPVY